MNGKEVTAPPVKAQGVPYCLVLDVPVTKRKNFHFLLDPLDNVLWSGMHIEDALIFLSTLEIKDFLLKTDSVSLRISLESLKFNQGGI